MEDSSSQSDPMTYTEAMSDIDSERWQQAMESEIDSMYVNQVWDLVDMPEGVRPIGCKWVFKRKTDADGKVQTYKARLVAKGYSQIQGIDYDETFSPVAKIRFIRTLLAIAAYHDYEIWQMDVKTAFLNGNLEEEVYMQQPEGFTSKANPKKVCKLQRSIYGLKQASRSWNIRFDEAVKSFDFVRSMEDPCVYSKRSEYGIVFMVIYVDDILIMGDNIPMLQSVKDWLSKTFMMKDLGEACYILGLKIHRDRSKRLLGLSQSTYIDKVLKRFYMEESKRGSLPAVHGVTLSTKDSPTSVEDINNMKKIPYASAVGSIMYAMNCTRPDVADALSLTCRYQKNPGMKHWTTVKTILKYLRRTKDCFLIYGGQEELVVSGYADASFQSDPDDYKS